MSHGERIVIVGAGLAGMCAAERLRELGFTDEIVILGTETTMPYHRPGLSKQFLTDEMSAADLTLKPLDDIDVTWRLGTSVSQLEPQHRVLRLPGDEVLLYDGLVIATGVEARRLGGGQHGHPRVVVMRTLDHAKSLRRILNETRDPVVVLGTGFTGCEIASSLRLLRKEVTIVGRSRSLMGNLLGPDLSRRLTELHRQRGVDLELGVQIDQWEPHNRSVSVLLSNGRTIDAACVVVAVGSVPSVAWLRDAGVELDDGVVCDETCHVVGVEDVVAAGDVAKWPNLLFDDTPRRVEHWTNAIEMGRAAAESLLAGRSAKPFAPIPRFWSEQHDLRIQAAGMPVLGAEQVMLRPTTPGGKSVTGYLHEGRLVGVVGFDSPGEVLAQRDALMQQSMVSMRKPLLQSVTSRDWDRSAERYEAPSANVARDDEARTVSRSR